MQPVADPFKAKADNFWETMNSYSGTVGFRVPEYQRTYDWSQEKIKRLLEDCLNGFYYLSQSKQESYTFLGTIILVLETPEHSFDGTSLSIVDGQQRLTTLILLCCALIEELLLRKEDIQNLREPVANWITREIEYIRESLFSCVIGQLQSLGKTFPFPRLVRRYSDNRARRSSDADYRSVVAKFLKKFANYYQKEEMHFLPQFKDFAEEKRCEANYRFIKEQVQLGIYKENNQQSELEHELIQRGDFERKGFRNLFEKLDILGNKEDRDRAISDISNTNDSSGLVRIILFSYYLLKSVILTRVQTRDEDSAFDIFDALNTTGEPLTALETFKPRIIRFESEIDRYVGSETELHFNRIKENLNDIYPETEKRQKATKELLVTFALYLEGYKLPLDLAFQRNYLRTKFDKVKDRGHKRRFVQSLADIAQFRQSYWNRDSIPGLNINCPNDVSERLKLCCMFILEMNTSLAIPVLARYWMQYRHDDNAVAFANAVQAVTAFLVLRRSITGTTGKIDADFRKIMKGESQSENSGLCVGLDHSNSLLSLDKLKETLRGYLEAPTIGVKNKGTWISRASEVGLAEYSRPLCRFLLFAASNNARPDTKNPGLLTREGITKSDELDFLNFRSWQDDKYATVEHVAPNSNSGSGWDEDIFRRPTTRHTMGNIVLLPKKENSSVGNASWTKKKIFYSALIAKTEEERNEQFEKAMKEGLDFRRETKNLLKKQGRLHMLDPIANVTDWTESLIQRRTKNTLELAWDIISPWLDY